jgi:hypothetical protein
VADVDIYNPEALGPPLGQYSHVARVKNTTETLYIAGMLAPGADFDAQCTGVFNSVAAALKSAGAGWSNVAQSGAGAVPGRSADHRGALVNRQGCLRSYGSRSLTGCRFFPRILMLSISTAAENAIAV